MVNNNNHYIFNLPYRLGLHRSEILQILQVPSTIVKCIAQVQVLIHGNTVDFAVIIHQLK